MARSTVRVLGWAALMAVAVLAAGGGSSIASAQSAAHATPGAGQTAPLNCVKPATPVDRTLCASADLKVSVEDVATTLRETLANTPVSERDAVLRGQQSFLSERDRTCAERASTDACLRLYNKRVGDIQALNSAAQKKLAAIAAAIPKDPKAAVAALQRYDGPAAKAWLVYLLQSGMAAPPDKDITREAMVRALTSAILRDLTLDPDMKEEMVKLGDVAVAPVGAALLLLRHVLSTTEMDAPCFLFTKHGVTAFEAFGAFWNSSRDASPALCNASVSVFDLPEWKKVIARMSPNTPPGQEDSGGLLRQNGGRQTEIDALQASLMPATLLDPPQSEDAKLAAEQRKAVLASFRAWRDFNVWSEADYKATVAALPAAISATAKLYRDTFNLSPSLAEQAARAAADRLIASHLSALMQDD